MTTEFKPTREFAQKLDENDPAEYRKLFYFPESENSTVVYLNGNSLGLQPNNVADYIDKELKDWQKYAVEGHFKSDTPWLSYHELLTEKMSKLIGAKNEETIIMNTLTVNLHLMMVSFYRPKKDKFKILMEYSPFPSDIYAVKSQIKFHGYNPDESLIFLEPSEGEIVSKEDIQRTFNEHGDEIALVLIGGVNYYTGQVYPMNYIGKLSREYNCMYGLDLAHAVGNVKLELHDWEVDFAVWCTYKYLNSGPGSVGGAFIHNKHGDSSELPRFAGWWGHNKETRFEMGPNFDPIFGAEGWQLSNPPILSLAAIRASLDIFDEIGMDKLVEKSKELISYTRYLIQIKLGDLVNILIPADWESAGCQLSLSLEQGGKKVHEQLVNKGVFCDWREPNVIRVAFAPLYNNFIDAYNFVNILAKVLNKE